MGIAIYSPAFLDFVPAGPSSVVNAWTTAAAAGHRIGTIDFTGSMWADVGTPEAYAAAVMSGLRDSGETLFFSSPLSCRHFSLGGNVVIEGACAIGEGSCISDSILLPGSTVAPGVVIEHSIIGPGFSVSFDLKKAFPSDMLPVPVAPRLRSWFGCTPETRLIGIGGSDRRYYRLTGGDKHAVLMQCRQEDDDFARHIAYTRFFREHRIPVPRLIAEDEADRQALFADLGDRSLYSWLKCRHEFTEVEEIYRSVLNMLVRLHGEVPSAGNDCPQSLKERIFDYDHLRWETGYFLERFVRGVCGLTPDDPGELDREFDLLARLVDRQPKTVMHRDFQSQNIMITHDSRVWMIDFQGARIGPPAYDLASILWDPYARIDGYLRDRLITHYCESISTAKGGNCHPDEMRQSLLFCRLQRHMQALGAYGFLASVKGKRHFLKHIPAAVRYLSDEAAQAEDRFPALGRLIQKVRERFP